MIAGFLELFWGGILVGSSSCLFFCAPVILPYLLGTSENWKKSFQAILLFSGGRIFIYTFYGLLIGLGKQIYLDNFAGSQLNFLLQIFVGLFILIIGFLLILGKEKKAFCPGLENLLIKHNLRTVFILGLFMGSAPCPPLLAAFAYIFFKTTDFISSIFLTLAFGLGTAISPLLVLGVFSGFIPQKLSGTKILRFLRIFAGFILMFWGFQIIASRLGLVIRL